MSKPKAIYMSGKIGDALLQWPVAHQWLTDNKERAEVWLDPSCRMLTALFEAQPCVLAVKIVDPAENFNCGGQPWQGNFTTDDHLAYEIVPLGFRAFPQRQITLQTALDCPLKVDTSRLATESAFDVGPVVLANRVVLHGTFQTHMSGVPRFWRFLRDVKHDLEARFDEIAFTGSPDERKRAREIYPNATCGPECAWSDFDDKGNSLELARFMAGSRLVMGSGSSGVALASVLKVPTVRVHDDMGGLPKAIWAGLGENQWNETEISLRKTWSEVLKLLDSDETHPAPRIADLVLPYSQFGEHVDIDEAVASMNGAGYAVDVGACDGVSLSNTKHLEDRGWDVLCIEANPVFEKFLSVNRKRHMMVACGKENLDDQDFFVYEVSPDNYEAVSSLKPAEDRPVHRDIEPKTVVKVNVRTLDWCLEQAGFPRLDVLTIDVEGGESDVLDGFDIAKWSPKVIVLEDWHGERFHERLKSAGYDFKVRRGVNDVFVRNA